jgi:hypothetical protein
MEEKRKLSISASPSVVVGLGEWGLKIVSGLREELIGVEPEMGLVTGFVALRGTSEGKIEAISITDSLNKCESVDMPRREAFEAFKAAEPQVRGEIYEALREVRTHRSLVSVGRRSERGLYVYIVADLNEGVSSGVLLPLCYEVKRLLVDQPQHSIVALLSIANFSPPSEQPEERALVYAALKELDHFMRMPYAKPDMSERMGFPVEEPPFQHCYLFDVAKEDGSLVEGPEELQGAVRLFLLSLLVSSFEEEVRKTLYRLGIQRQRGFYSSAGVAALSYPVGRAIGWCAARLGSEFIEEELLNPARLNLSALDEVGERAGEDVLGLRGWMGRLVEGTLAKLVGEGYRIELEVDRPNFGEIAKEDWADSIASFDSLFGTHRFPLYLKKVEENAPQVREGVLSRLSEALDSALNKAHIYPSGIPGARKVLEKLEETLAKRKQELERYRADFPENPEGDLRALEEAALNFPPFTSLLARLLLLCALEFYLTLAFSKLLPLLSSLLPLPPFPPLLSPILSFLLCLLTIAGGLYWFKRKDDILIGKREKCMDNFQRKYSLMLERRAISEMSGIVEKVEERLGEMKGKLEDFQKKLEGAKEGLLQGLRVELAKEAPFVHPVLNGKALNDLYLRFAPPREAMLHTLLEVAGLLDDWASLTEEAIRKELLSFGENAFGRYLRDLSLDRLMLERRPPSPEGRLRPLLELAVPPLRFSFDGLGEGLSAYSEDFIALENLSTSVLSGFISEELREFKPFSTGDRYHIFLCRTRHLLPLVSIGTVVNLLGEPYRKMDEEERRALHLFDEWADLPEPSI